MTHKESNTQVYRRLGKLLAEQLEDQQSDDELRNKISQIRSWIKTRNSTRAFKLKRGKQVIPREKHEALNDDDEQRISRLKDLLLTRSTKRG
jgi:hypothetical protein